jgi:hypothetical protein
MPFRTITMTLSNSTVASQPVTYAGAAPTFRLADADPAAADGQALPAGRPFSLTPSTCHSPHGTLVFDAAFLNRGWRAVFAANRDVVLAMDTGQNEQCTVQLRSFAAALIVQAKAMHQASSVLAIQLPSFIENLTHLVQILERLEERSQG